MEQLRAGAYCRVSTLLEKQGISLSAQIKYYEDLFENDPTLINAGIYIDQGISGRTISRRGQFKQMLRDAREGKLDVIYCKSITRFGRNTLDTMQSIEMLKQRNIPVIFDIEGINTLNDKDFSTILMSYLAQDEVEKDVEYGNLRVKRSFEKGQLISRLNSLLGYDWDVEKKCLKVNPVEAEVVRRIFEMYVKGVETRQICRILTEEGFTTNRGLPFDSSAILRIIHQEKYTGNMRLGKFYTDKYGMTKINHGEKAQYYVENSHEAIISQEIFDKAQEVCQSRRLCFDTGIREEDPFRCKVYCGVCGKHCDRLQDSKSQNPKVRVSYRCVKAVKNGPKACANHQQVKIWTIQSGFIASCNKLKEVRFNFDKSYETVESNNLSKEIDGLLQQEKIYMQMNVNGLLNDRLKKEYKQLVDKIMELQERKKSLVNKSIALNELKKNSKIAKEIFSGFDKMTTFDNDTCSALISKVVIHSRAEIEYFFKFGISVTVKFIPYMSMDDDITEVIVHDSIEC